MTTPVRLSRSMSNYIVCWSFIYLISRSIRHTFFPEKCDLNSTCVLCAKSKYYLQTYKYPYIYYTTSLSCYSEICFQIMRSGITACEGLNFLSGDLPHRIHCITCDSGYFRCCSSKVQSSVIQVLYTFLKVYLPCAYLRFYKQ